jgi:NitT/TauT family transport system ATP-binding protein
MASVAQEEDQMSPLPPHDPHRHGTVVSIQDLSKRFRRGAKEFLALDHISLTISPGEFIALIGPSGCGKSTLLRLLADLELPSEGTILIDGLAPSVIRLEHKMGVAFQQATLLPWRTLEENICMPLKLAKKRVDHEAVANIISLFGLKGFEKYRPAQLSGGMQQRVSLARALIIDPKLLLLDEPFGALDEMIRQRLNLELQRIWSENPMTTVLVTHSISEAVFLADRVVVMKTNPGGFGEIVDIDLPRPRRAEDLRSQEFHAYCDRLSELLFESAKD